MQQQRDPARVPLRHLPVRWRRAATIDAAAPAAALDFSADGLRRLARSLDPQFTGDPLEHSDVPDPRLQELFRFRDPDAPPRRPRRTPPGTTWDRLWPRHAHAADGDTEWQGLAARLDRWVPVNDELPDYRATVDRLLTMAAERGSIPMRSTNGSTSSSPIS